MTALRVADETTAQQYAAFVAMKDARDDAEARISLALLRLDEFLDHAPEECSCEDGRVCLLHAIEDDLRGVTR